MLRRISLQENSKNCLGGRAHPGQPKTPAPPYNGFLARRRFFVDTIRAGIAELLGDEALHLTRVLRVEAGQQFEISDNASAWLAEVVEARGQRVVFRVIEPPESP